MQITTKEKRLVNKQFRDNDQSHLYPIFNQFNVAERAIRKARELARNNGEFSSAYEYELTLGNYASEIVNSH